MIFALSSNVFVVITPDSHTSSHPDLYFHGHLPAVLHPRQVNLADGRRCKRTLLERLQLVSPVRTQVAVQSLLQVDKSKTRQMEFCVQEDVT